MVGHIQQSPKSVIRILYFPIQHVNWGLGEHLVEQPTLQREPLHKPLLALFPAPLIFHLSDLDIQSVFCVSVRSDSQPSTLEIVTVSVHLLNTPCPIRTMKFPAGIVVDNTHKQPIDQRTLCLNQCSNFSIALRRQDIGKLKIIFDHVTLIHIVSLGLYICPVIDVHVGDIADRQKGKCHPLIHKNNGVISVLCCLIWIALVRANIAIDFRNPVSVSADAVIGNIHQPGQDHTGIRNPRCCPLASLNNFLSLLTIKTPQLFGGVKIRFEILEKPKGVLIYRLSHIIPTARGASAVGRPIEYLSRPRPDEIDLSARYCCEIGKYIFGLLRTKIIFQRPLTKTPQIGFPPFSIPPEMLGDFLSVVQLRCEIQVSLTRYAPNIRLMDL